jgi:hypothetical protein
MNPGQMNHGHINDGHLDTDSQTIPKCKLGEGDNLIPWLNVV